MAKRGWTDAELAQITKLRTVERLSYNDIARRYGVHTQSMANLCRRLGLYHKGEVVKGRGKWSVEATSEKGENQMLLPYSDIPIQMRTLERDARGYPIPFIVTRDKKGQAMFTINDVEKVERCVRSRLCGICGKKLRDNFWFVGGSILFVGPEDVRGMFIDPPSHMECATYALRVCPFLVARSFKMIETARLKPENAPDNSIVLPNNMSRKHPRWFGLGETESYNKPPQWDAPFIVRRWRYVEFWRRGQWLDSVPRELTSETMEYYDAAE